MNQLGYLKVAAGVPQVTVADCEANYKAIIDLAKKAYDRNVDVLVLPELCVTGYTCGDLFGQRLLLDQAETTVKKLIKKSEGWEDLVLIVGAPVPVADKLFNCAIVIQAGEIRGIVPKTYIPNYGEFYEQRWFASGQALDLHKHGFILIDYADTEISLGPRLLFTKGSATIGVELCEDLWVPNPPSSVMAEVGADVIVNLSASDEVIGKHAYLRQLIAQQSARCRAAYVYASAGYGESSTDLVFAGNAIVAENGAILAEAERFATEPRLAVADVDIDKLHHDRLTYNTFACFDHHEVIEWNKWSLLDLLPDEELAPERPVDAHPFVPADDARLNERCSEIIAIQTLGLMRRLEHTHSRNAVIGISGGLDSTLALLVTVNAFNRLKLPLAGIHGITMPGFGTTGRTYQNSLALMKELGINAREISIVPAVNQHFSDIGQDPERHDITYENSQARERAQILMDYANKVGAMVIGTGDLSELALGWATYNGDHMSMYGVNAGIPKTLVRHLVRWYATAMTAGALQSTLLDIVDTPISPELLPADADGNIKQITEDTVGPYELHDFFLYNMIRNGFEPRKIYALARVAFKGNYDAATIKRWLREFYRRFFAQQFKRSCLPDGPKVGSVTLSPRGDWRMPSDASAAMWLAQCDAL